jgi:prevent-host-death family protein
MDSYSVADAKARFSEVVERAEAGETVEITKRGKLVARVVPIVQPRKPVDVDALERLAARIPSQKEDAGTFVRRMRDKARY